MMRKLTPSEVLMAFLVDVIRNLWDKGMYRQDKWLQMCHDEWFDVWTIWRTSITMSDVDRQIEEMHSEPLIDDPIYWEEEKGETPLGGAMGFSYDFVDRSRGRSNPVQGAEQRKADG